MNTHTRAHTHTQQTVMAFLAFNVTTNYKSTGTRHTSVAHTHKKNLHKQTKLTHLHALAYIGDVVLFFLN